MPVKKGKLLKAPDFEKGGRDAGGGRRHLPFDVTELVFGHLPLAQKARAARVCKSWATGYTASLAARQQQLKSLKAQQHFGRSFRVTMRSYLADHNLIFDLHCLLRLAINEAFVDSSQTGFDSSLPSFATLWHCRAPKQFNMWTQTSLDPANPTMVLLNLHFGVAAADNLPWLVGLLLELAQEELPKVLANTPFVNGHRQLRVRVHCLLAFASGWEDWVALAALCGAVRLTVSPDCRVLEPDRQALDWLPELRWEALPADEEFSVIASAPDADERPLAWLHIKAHSWEPAASATCLAPRRGTCPLRAQPRW